MQVFIYGTLKKDGCRAHSMSGANFIGDIKTAPNYTLFSVNGQYPALVESVESGVAVKGELWEVPESVMQKLDQIEGAPYLYKRQVIELEDKSEATTYVFQHPTDNFDNVGDFWENV